MRKVQLALRVTVDVAGEPVAGQILRRAVIDHPAISEKRQSLVVEGEVGYRVEQSTSPADDAVAAPIREAAGEDLEGAQALRRPVAQRRAEHGEFVAVGEERAGHGSDRVRPGDGRRGATTPFGSGSFGSGS